MDIKVIQNAIDSVIEDYIYTFTYERIMSHPSTYISLNECGNKFIHFNKRYILWYSNKKLIRVIDRANKAMFVCSDDAEGNIHYLIDFCDFYTTAYEIIYYHSI